MTEFLDLLLHYSTIGADNIWWPVVILLLAGTGIYLSFQTGFIQIRRLGLAFKLMFRGRDKEEMEGRTGDITPFQALMTALAATVGNGNIAGVATAIASGGPGAPFWMWMTAVFGMATKYAEGMLGLHFRVRNEDGTYSGGAMYYLRDGIRWKAFGKFLALWFSIAVIVMATFGSGNMAQSNSIALALNSDFGIPFIGTGIGLAILVGIVIIGGVKRIAAVAERLVPGMIVLYMGAGMYVILTNVLVIPDIIMIVLRSALTNEAMVGGFLGHTVKEAIRYGIARGLFSNESGLGSAPIVAAAAQTKNPVRQALVSSTGTFWDTVVVCAMTGLVVVNSGEWMNGLRGAELTNTAFTDIPLVGPIVLTIGLLTFVFSTILGWSYYGEKAAEYLWGPRVVAPYRWLWVVAVMLGSILSLPIVWTFADIANGLMAIPNLITLLVLTGVLIAETRTYLWNGTIDADIKNTDTNH